MTETLEIKKPLSERPIGYVLAVLGGLLGGPLGLVTSPGALFLLNKNMKGKEGKQPNRFAIWALIGIIGAPISLAIGNPEFRKGFSDGYNENRKVEKPTDTKDPSKTVTLNPPRPKEASWSSSESKEQLEKGIKENFSLAVTGAKQSVASVSCTPTKTERIWMCNLRLLGEETTNRWRMEVAENGTWAGKQVNEP